MNCATSLRIFLCFLQLALVGKEINVEKGRLGLVWGGTAVRVIFLLITFVFSP